MKHLITPPSVCAAVLAVTAALAANNVPAYQEQQAPITEETIVTSQLDTPSFRALENVRSESLTPLPDEQLNEIEGQAAVYIDGMYMGEGGISHYCRCVYWQ